MPTPFSHLRITYRLLHDSQIPADLRDSLCDHQADFLLGGVVVDAKPKPHSTRADTHFYHYQKPMPDNPWREMLRQHRSLTRVTDPAHRAFLMGYIAHLAADEYWSRYMLKPHFANGDWGASMSDRFFILHLLLTHMDERDEAALPSSVAMTLRQSQPHHWLPFMSDNVICDWRDFIADQLIGESQTLNIFGGRIQLDPRKMRQMLDDEDYMQRRLWQHITPQLLADLEDKLYAFSRQQLLAYVTEFVPDLA